MYLAGAIFGRRLIAGNPFAGLVIPTEKNARRPVATEARYQQLLAVADVTEPTGRFRCVLTIARYTGRRISAICAPALGRPPYHCRDPPRARDGPYGSRPRRAVGAQGDPVRRCEMPGAGTD